MWRQLLVTFVMAAALCALYSVIFHFSDQDGGESSSISWTISGKWAEFLNFISGSGRDAEATAEMASYFEYPLRKFAHFSEYTCMGILVYILGSQWIRQGRRLWFLTCLWVFFSAAGDELHQYFVPGRCASMQDVFLDTCGGIFDIFFCFVIYGLYSRRKRKAERLTEGSSG